MSVQGQAYINLENFSVRQITKRYQTYLNLPVLFLSSFDREKFNNFNYTIYDKCFISFFSCLFLLYVFADKILNDLLLLRQNDSPYFIIIVCFLYH